MKVRISAWAIRNPTPVSLLFVALTIWGVLAYGALPIKHYPNVNFPLVSVNVTQNGAAAPEMESQITRPIDPDVPSAILGMSDPRRQDRDRRRRRQPRGRASHADAQGSRCGT